MQDPHTSQDTTRLCLQDPHRAWSLVRDTTRRTHTPLRTPHVSAYKTRTEHGRWLETLHAGPTHLSGHRTSLPTRPAQMVRDATSRTDTPKDIARLCLQDPHCKRSHLPQHCTSLPKGHCTFQVCSEHSDTTHNVVRR